MKTEMKGNNKGFSLVELIVVMAIMAILAVTLAPRLMHYVEKANTASDQQAVSTIFSAVQLAYVQNTGDFVKADALDGVTDGKIVLKDNKAVQVATAALYNVDTTKNKWTINSGYATTNEFVNELRKILKDFTLKDKRSSATTQITISVIGEKVSVVLDYDGDLKSDYTALATATTDDRIDISE